MALNIALLAAASTAAIHLKDAAGEPLYDAGKPVRIVLHSPGSAPYGIIESRQTARALKRMHENDGKVTPPSREERIAETAEDLAAVTIAFENFDYQPDGSSAALTGEALFRALYADPGLGFIVKQVTRFLGDWGNFKPASIAA